MQSQAVETAHNSHKTTSQVHRGSETWHISGKQALAAHWMLRRGGSCFGRASLVGVRQVRVSSGDFDRSRHAGHISGLWIDYWDDREAVIVGQWMREIGGFELEQDEVFTEIRTWSSDDIRFSTPAEKFGQIFGICFMTSSGKRAEFNQGGLERGVTMRYQATPWEEIVSTSC